MRSGGWTYKASPEAQNPQLLREREKVNSSLGFFRLTENIQLPVPCSHPHLPKAFSPGRFFIHESSTDIVCIMIMMIHYYHSLSITTMIVLIHYHLGSIIASRFTPWRWRQSRTRSDLFLWIDIFFLRFDCDCIFCNDNNIYTLFFFLIFFSTPVSCDPPHERNHNWLVRWCANEALRIHDGDPWTMIIIIRNI